LLLETVGAPDRWFPWNRFCSSSKSRSKWFKITLIPSKVHEPYAIPRAMCWFCCSLNDTRARIISSSLWHIHNHHVKDIFLKDTPENLSGATDSLFPRMILFFIVTVSGVCIPAGLFILIGLISSSKRSWGIFVWWGVEVWVFNVFCMWRRVIVCLVIHRWNLLAFPVWRGCVGITVISMNLVVISVSCM
jgi:hypothetical protein